MPELNFQGRVSTLVRTLFVIPIFPHIVNCQLLSVGDSKFCLVRHGEKRPLGREGEEHESAPEILVLDTLIEQLLQVVHENIVPVDLGHKDESAVTVDVVKGKVTLKEKE